MKVVRTNLLGVLLIEPSRIGDMRGFFAETYNKRSYQDAGIKSQFVQDNHSVSESVGTVRGLHFQAPPSSQAKLVRCGRGAIFDVAVDIRLGSPTYGRWIGYELSADNGLQLFVPSGFAHGFMTLKPDSEIVYKCSGFYAPETEGSVKWDDPAIAIAWPDIARPVFSTKDAEAPLLSQIVSPFHWETAR